MLETLYITIEYILLAFLSVTFIIQIYFYIHPYSSIIRKNKKEKKHAPSFRFFGIPEQRHKTQKKDGAESNQNRSGKRHPSKAFNSRKVAKLGRQKAVLCCDGKQPGQEKFSKERAKRDLSRMM